MSVFQLNGLFKKRGGIHTRVRDHEWVLESDGNLSETVSKHSRACGLYTFLSGKRDEYDVHFRTLYDVKGTDEPSMNDLSNTQLIAIRVAVRFAEGAWAQAFDVVRDAPHKAVLWRSPFKGTNQLTPLSGCLSGNFGAMTEEEQRRRRLLWPRNFRARRAVEEAEDNTKRERRLTHEQERDSHHRRGWSRERTRMENASQGSLKRWRAALNLATDAENIAARAGSANGSKADRLWNITRHALAAARSAMQEAVSRDADFALKWTGHRHVPAGGIRQIICDKFQLKSGGRRRNYRKEISDVLDAVESRL